MNRIHLIELEDQTWCPPALRDYATDYLRVVQKVSKPYKAAAPLLAQALKAAGTNQVLDLCSGGAGSWPYLLPAITKTVPGLTVTLSDKYPNIAAFAEIRALFGEQIAFQQEPIDATFVPPQLNGFRCMFTALHHFRPDQVRDILSDCQQGSKGFAAFECTSCSIRAIIAMLLTPLFVLLLTPFIRPFKWSRIFWTYLIPIVPLLAFFDGVVSCLRTYSVGELEVLTEGLDNSAFAWQAGVVSGAILPLTYLIGLPKNGESRPIPVPLKTVS